MVQAFVAQCADDTFGDGILPWTSWCSWCVFQAKVPYVSFEIIAKGSVVVADNIFGYVVKRKRSTKLLNSPPRVRICSDRKMQHFASSVRYGNKDVSGFEEDRSDDQEVNAYDMLGNRRDFSGMLAIAVAWNYRRLCGCPCILPRYCQKHQIQAFWARLGCAGQTILHSLFAACV